MQNVSTLQGRSSEQDPSTNKKFETGIASFDLISGGGLPRSSALALIGNAGCEKTLLARHIMWNVLQKGAKVLYYSVDQSAEELRYDLSSYGWEIKSYEDDGLLRIVDVFSSGKNTMMKELRKYFGNGTADSNENFSNFKSKMSDKGFQKKIYDLNLIYKEGIRFISPISIRRYPYRLCIFDSVSPLFSTNTQGVFQLVQVLKFATRSGKATGIGIMHGGMHEDKTEAKFKSLADAIIEIKTRGETTNFITLLKYPGKHRTGFFPLEANDQGVNIIPMVMPELF